MARTMKIDLFCKEGWMEGRKEKGEREQQREGRGNSFVFFIL